jgi:hypothetical protein
MVVAALIASSVAGPARGDADAGADDVDVVLRCPPQGTGRVRCTIDAEARPHRAMTWADVVVISTPAFATPLRGRLAPEDAIDQTRERWRWEFALGARTRGRGDVTVRVRAIVCVQNTCKPWQRDATAQLVVGE